MKEPTILLHPSAKDALDNFIATPSHAVLLAGPAGTGKTFTATELATQLLHVDSAALASHPYHTIIAPGAGSIGIEQVRELIKLFKLKAPGSASIKRVAIIQDADQMGSEAQNALLKILEEPPTDSVLILTSSAPQQLLPTIRSRMQMLQLPSPSTMAVQTHFERQGYGAQSVAAARLRAGTNLAKLEQLLTTPLDSADQSLVLVKQALGGSSYDRLLLVDGLAKQKDAAMTFVDTLLSVASVSLGAAAAKLPNAAGLDRWKNVLQSAHIAQSSLERSGNTKIVLTELMLTL